MNTIILGFMFGKNNEQAQSFFEAMSSNTDILKLGESVSFQEPTKSDGALDWLLEVFCKIDFAAFTVNIVSGYFSNALYDFFNSSRNSSNNVTVNIYLGGKISQIAIETNSSKEEISRQIAEAITNIPRSDK